MSRTRPACRSRPADWLWHDSHQHGGHSGDESPYGVGGADGRSPVPTPGRGRPALNLKTHDAHELARELADLTGETMSEAVTVSIRERRDRVRAAHQAPLPERLVAIGH